MSEDPVKVGKSLRQQLQESAWRGNRESPLGHAVIFCRKPRKGYLYTEVSLNERAYEFDLSEKKTDFTRQVILETRDIKSSLDLYISRDWDIIDISRFCVPHEPLAERMDYLHLISSMYRMMWRDQNPHRNV